MNLGRVRPGLSGAVAEWRWDLRKRNPRARYTPRLTDALADRVRRIIRQQDKRERREQGKRGERDQPDHRDR